jgi:hypothetical protein
MESARAHADTVLNFVQRDLSPNKKRDAQQGFLKFAEELVKAADRNPAIRMAIDEVITWKSGKKIIEDETYRRYCEIHKPETQLGSSESPGIGLATSIGYLRALQMMSDPKGQAALKQGLEQPQLLLETVQRGISKLEPDFLGQLLISAEERRSEEPEFAKSIERARKELDHHTRDLKELARELDLKSLATPGAEVPMLDQAQKAGGDVTTEAVQVILILGVVITVSEAVALALLALGLVVLIIWIIVDPPK